MLAGKGCGQLALEGQKSALGCLGGGRGQAKEATHLLVLSRLWADKKLYILQEGFYFTSLQSTMQLTHNYLLRNTLLDGVLMPVPSQMCRIREYF